MTCAALWEQEEDVQCRLLAHRKEVLQLVNPSYERVGMLAKLL